MNDLLKVLDMSEDSPEQYGWLLSTIREHKACCPADLAFRLRDEAIAEDDKSEINCSWCEASYEVYLYVIGEENEMEAKEGLDTWFSMRAKPIHWIIAALIAKEKAND